MLYRVNNFDSCQEIGTTPLEKYFYHIPKTGGRAYKKHNNLSKDGLCGKRNCSGNHAGGHIWITKKESINKTIIVSLRDPVDRFLSAYYYTKLGCNVKGDVHYNNPTISKLRNSFAWKNSPLEMLQYIQKEDKLLDDMSYFDFYSTYSWCKDIPKNSIELLDFVTIQREKGHPERYDGPKGFASQRTSIENENNILDIIHLVKELNPNDYTYFNDITGGEKICNGWL